MYSFKLVIKNLLSSAVKKKFPQAEIEVKIEHPASESHGDYAANTPMALAQALKKNPKEIAEELIKTIKKPDWIAKIQPAGAGFINFFLSEECLTEFVCQINEAKDSFGHSDEFNGKTILTDTSHPNIAKPMGAHHLLSTIIGGALNNILAAAGYKVIKDNYLGDWGTQFGKLIYAYKTWGDEKTVRKDPIPELLKLYVKFHDEVEKNPKLEDFGRAEFKKLEDRDKENRRLWQWIVSLSMEEFNKIYKRLGIKFDVIHGESFYENKMQEIIDLGVKKGIFTTGEGGALIAPFAHGKYPPCLIRKSDGATLYATRDLARTKYWEDTWHPDLMIMVTDTAQSLHFTQFFEVADMLGITDAKNIHITFGRMRFPEKKMSTRKGNIVLLEDLLDEAVSRARKIIEEKNPELPEDKKHLAAEQIGIGAIKFAVLAQNRNTDTVFTWGKMLSLEGASGPYLQYAHARAKAILRKVSSCAPEGGQKLKSSTMRGQKEAVSVYLFKEPHELAIARILPRFPEVVLTAAQEFKPNLIAGFLYDLASRFNSFYASVPVLKTENEDVRNARLALVEAVAVTLKNGLALLGINAPDEM